MWALNGPTIKGEGEPIFHEWGDGKIKKEEVKTLGLKLDVALQKLII